MRMTLARIGLALGGLLMIVRIMPVMAAKPADMAFPPPNTTELVRLAEAAQGAWPFSHWLGFLAIGLLLSGYWLRAGCGLPIVQYLARGLASVGLGLFFVALIIDGFLLYEFARWAGESGSDGAMEATRRTHEFATGFYGTGVFIFFTAMGTFAAPLTHRGGYQRLLGYLGMLIALAAVIAYWTGLAGPNWSNIKVGGMLMMAAFAWHMLVGVTGAGLRPAATDRPNRAEALAD